MLRRGQETITELLSPRNSSAETDADLFANQRISGEPTHTTYRLDQGDGIERPLVVIPRNEDSEDFFAAMATHHSGSTPISALTHVLGGQTAMLFSTKAKLRGRVESGEIHTNRKILLGAALGEAVLSGISAEDHRPAPTFGACRRTFAFSLCRAMELYGRNLNPGMVADRWVRLRRLSKQDCPYDAIDASLSISNLLSGVTEGPWTSTLLKPKDFSGIEHSMREGGAVWRRIASSYPSVEPHAQGLKGPFDGRLTAFTKIVAAIHSNSLGPQSDDIAIAFFCNSIFPGSFSHTGVLAKLVEFHPSAIVWYGAFAAATLSPTGGPEKTLLEKLDRDAVEAFSFEQRPRCDISLDELEVLSRVSLPADQFHPTHPRSLLVSILPGLDILARISADAPTRSAAIAHASVTDSESGEIASLLEKALGILRRSGAPPEARGWSKTRKKK